MNVRVTAPDFRSIEASGASNVTSTGRIEAATLSIRSGGASDIDLDIQVQNLDITCTGSSTSKLRGTADNIKAKLSGASDIKAASLVCNNLDATLSGSSDMHITVKSLVSGRASGASTLIVNGNPSMHVHTSGSATARINR
jgi:hypothetical protein